MKKRNVTDFVIHPTPVLNRTASELLVDTLRNRLANLRAMITPCPQQLHASYPLERLTPRLIERPESGSGQNSPRMEILPRCQPQGRSATETAESLVSKGRKYGNLLSQRNAQQMHQVYQVQQSGAGDSPEIDYYNHIKSRLIMMDAQHFKMMSIYGRDNFLEEFTELLEACASFEQDHSSLEPYAILKINDIHMMRRK